VTVVAVVLALALVVAVVVALSRRNEPDTLDSFRRQIDALSPEARRSVVNQVQRFEQAEQAGPREQHGFRLRHSRPEPDASLAEPHQIPASAPEAAMPDEHDTGHDTEHDTGGNCDGT
jgi:hypothetical protein